MSPLKKWWCPKCIKHITFKQRWRHVREIHPDMVAESLLALPDENGHTSKCNIRRRKKFSSRRKANEKSKIDGSGSNNKSEEALAFKTANHDATIVIAPQPDLVMWVPVNPVKASVVEQRTLRVTIPATSDDKRAPWLSKQRLKAFRNSLGNGFVYFGRKGEDWYLHQWVVTMELLYHYCKCPVDPVSWSTLWNIKENALNYKFFEPLLAASSPRRVLFILFWAHDFLVSDDLLSKLYGQLEALEMKLGLNLTVFPRRSEAGQDRGKVKDILTLNEFAKKTGKYRPVTCFPGRQCVLRGVDSFHKRNNSSGCEHTGKRPSTYRGELSCILPNLCEPATSAISSAISPGGYVWFHQEFVNTFDKIGEFRVFLVTEPCSSGGLRGLSEKVVHICKTSFDKGTVLPREATPEDLSACPSLNLDKLCSFAVEIHRQFRERHDWREAHESKEIAVRLDIGVSPDLKDFFVNEVNPPWSADFFSDDVLAHPKHRICDAIARATKHYLFRSQKSVHI